MPNMEIDMNVIPDKVLISKSAVKFYFGQFQISACEFQKQIFKLLTRKPLQI